MGLLRCMGSMKAISNLTQILNFNWQNTKHTLKWNPKTNRYKCLFYWHKLHCGQVITMTSPWARWHLKSPASPLFTQPFIRAHIKENIKAPRHWPLCGEFTGDRWIPAQLASNTENVSIWWSHHVMACCLTAPSHYLNQCWLIFSKVQWHSVEFNNLTTHSLPFNH